MSTSTPFSLRTRSRLIAAAVAVARAEGLSGGHRLVTNTGPDAGQSVAQTDFHSGGRVLGGQYGLPIDLATKAGEELTMIHGRRARDPGILRVLTECGPSYMEDD